MTYTETQLIRILNQETVRVLIQIVYLNIILIIQLWLYIHYKETLGVYVLDSLEKHSFDLTQ